MCLFVSVNVFEPYFSVLFTFPLLFLLDIFDVSSFQNWGKICRSWQRKNETLGLTGGFLPVHRNTEKQLIYWSLSRTCSQVFNVFQRILGMEIFSSGVSSHVLLLKGIHAYCNLLCLTALVSQGERGIMGACEHCTVIGYPSYIGAGFWSAHGPSQHNLGLGLAPQPRRSHFSVVASLFIWFQPSLPPEKKVK